MMIRLLFCFAVLTPGALAAQERYGFVARLGVDTISVESITRSPDKLVSDQVERFPRVIRRHTEILFSQDKTVRHVAMDILMPSAVTPKWHERHLAVEYLADSIRLTITNGEGTHTVMLGTDGAPMLPWTAHLYSLTELFLNEGLRRGGDSAAVRLYYVDAQAEEYPALTRLHSAGYVRALPGGKVEVFRHDGLAGAGEGTLDSRGRMLAYSGARSTYKVEVARLTKTPDVEAITRAFVETEKKFGVPSALSVRDTMRATLGDTRLQVDYGRPLARGRTLLGGVLPFSEVWRTGANAATQFTTSSAITLAGLDLAPGTYTLWTIPSSAGAVLIVNRQFGQWGTQYDSTKDLGRAPLKTEAVATPTEKFTISVVPTNARSGSLVLQWGTFRWTAPLVVK